MSNLSKTVSNDGQNEYVQNDSRISIFADVRHSREPIGTLDLPTVLFSTKPKDRITKLRTHEKGSEEFQHIKSSLPCYTPSGLFSQRNKEGLIRHSGFLCVEWDNLNPDMIKDVLSKCDFIYYAGLSCSGKGVFAIVKIADPTQHIAYFRALRAYFDELNMPIDISGSDITRLRVASYDPNPIFNADSTVWDRILPTVQYAPVVIADTDMQQRLFLCGLDYVQRYGIDITAGRNNWLALGSTIKTFFGNSGENYFVSLSQYHPKFSEQECRRTYQSLRAGNYGIGVFCLACSRAGVPRLNTLIINN